MSSSVPAPTGVSQRASETGGVKPMSIAGRMVDMRQRLAGMTDEERAWRAQWLKDQKLTAREPVFVPEYWERRTNPIRRFYKWPLDKLFGALRPVIGEHRANVLRFFTGKYLMGAYALFGIFYYFKYQGNDWTTKSGWRVVRSRYQMLPGDPGYPGVEHKKPSDYANRGFKDSPI